MGKQYLRASESTKWLRVETRDREAKLLGNCRPKVTMVVTVEMGRGK